MGIIKGRSDEQVHQEYIIHIKTKRVCVSDSFLNNINPKMIDVGEGFEPSPGN